MVSTPKLTETSYAVLGLLEHCQPATAYQLKQIAQQSTFHFWSIPHTQLYTECARLAESGLLDEHQQQTSRRRRVYRLSPAGRKALERWRADPRTELYELRDPGLLKLFCGADPAAVAAAQLPQHKQRLERYKQLHGNDLPQGVRLALESGIAHENEYIRFWTGLQTHE